MDTEIVERATKRARAEAQQQPAYPWKREPDWDFLVRTLRFCMPYSGPLYDSTHPSCCFVKPWCRTPGTWRYNRNDDVWTRFRSHRRDGQCPCQGECYRVASDIFNTYTQKIYFFKTMSEPNVSNTAKAAQGVRAWETAVVARRTDPMRSLSSRQVLAQHRKALTGDRKAFNTLDALNM